MICIIDYGAGNLRSIRRAIEANGVSTEISGDPERISRADRLVLPGVGNAKAAMDQLRSTGLADALSEQAQQGTPLLGVCLGMQLLFDAQEEGPTRGLGLLAGDVVKLTGDLKVPHMGWNTVSFTPHSQLAGLGEQTFYFVHSYHAHPDDETDIAGVTNYGDAITSVVIRDNVWGMQFHPEKSHQAGIDLIGRWLQS